jgi:hypothetical protein
MDALQDATWIKYLYATKPVERFNHGPFKAVAISMPPTAAHHQDQYRYRLLFFEATGTSPVMAVNLESDLLGGWRLTFQCGATKRIVDTFDALLPYETFRALALPLVDDETVYSLPCKPKRAARPKK